jgi:tRNA A-37 threonylcarbamoyl transferase component Bud32/tetratricopeptide (TPR) repeat protein
MESVDRYARAKRIFLEASRLPRGEQPRFIRAQCADDPALIDQVDRLLALDEAEADFLETPALGAVPEAISAGMRLGRFRILRVLGEGGMGIVYEAEEDEPRRRVALKLIRPGFFSERLRSRFRHEIRVLGQLRHPGIAQIYEAGTLETSGEQVPYFAMELVEGRALLQCAEEARLGVRERLTLVAQICDAVHHAHQKGVIHRDLKPGNILVEEAASTDSASASGGIVPLQIKILDFGIARATDSEVITVSLQTESGQLVGTVPYMSPEQAAGRTDAVDIRSDVYSIGVIAFELLARRLPYGVRGRALHEAARIIHESEPTRLGSIDRSLRGDIETIVAKALEKEPERRYDSAAEMALDIRRFLRHEPISARPPSALYHLRTYARRHKPVVAAAALVALALVGATGVSTYFAVREHGARLQAVEQGEVARKQAARVQRINEFLLDDMFSTGGMGAASGRTDPAIRLVDYLDAAAPRIPSRFADDPLMEAHLRQLVAHMYLHFGRYQDGLNLIEPALALCGPVQDPLKERYLERIKLVYGTLLSAVGRVPEGERVLRELLPRAEARGSDQVLSIKGSLAEALASLQKFDEAELILKDLMAEYRSRLPQGAIDYIVHGSRLGPIYYMQNRFEELLALSDDMVAVIEAHSADNHPAMNTALFWRSLAYSRLGRDSEAADAAVHVADYALRSMKPGHPNIGVAQINAASALSRVGRHKEAKERARDGYDRVVAGFGSRHYEAERYADQVASVYKRADSQEEYSRWRTQYLVLRYYVAGPSETESLDKTFRSAAEELGADTFADRLEAECASLADDPKRARFYANAAWSLASHGRGERAEALLLDAATCWKGDDLPNEVLQAVRERLPRLLESRGRQDDAAAWRERLGAGDGAH